MHKLTIPVLGLFFLLSSTAFAAERDLSVGMKGEDVVKLQEFLITENHGAAAKTLAAAGATGTFGQLTRAAVVEFQKAKGIAPAYGYVGAKTRAQMNKPLAAPTFSGSVEAVDTGCFADGICSVTVNGKKVIVTAGMRVDVPPLGRIIGADSIGDIGNMIGATAQVYAATSTDEGYDYTLYGSKDYYLKITPVVPKDGRISVTGTVICLPPKDMTKPTIMMCAYGLKATDGNYYKLSDPKGKLPAANYDAEDTVRISGTFTAGEDATWNSVGVIELKTISLNK